MKDNYFENIDSDSKAYILGFLCADASLSKKYNKISFHLNPKDKSVLEFIKKEIELTAHISYSINFDKRTNKNYHLVNLQFSNKKIRNDLENLGVTSNKSSILNFPNIEYKFNWSFIRGLFDGDGFISKDGKKVSIISTKEILDFIRNISLNHGIYWAEYREQLSGNIYKMFLNKNVYKLYYLFYENSSYHFIRKEKKFKNSLKNLLNKNKMKIKRQVELKKNNENHIFDSIKDASKFLNCNPALISNTLSGNQKTVRGYRVQNKGIRKVRESTLKIGLDLDG